MAEPAPERLSELPASWLLANCQCHTCVDPVSGQRLVAITDIEPDGHHGEYPASLAGGRHETRRQRRPVAGRQAPVERERLPGRPADRKLAHVPS